MKKKTEELKIAFSSCRKHTRLPEKISSDQNSRWSCQLCKIKPFLSPLYLRRCMRRSIVGFHRAASKSLAHTTTNTTRDKSFTENTGFFSLCLRWFASSSSSSSSSSSTQREEGYNASSGISSTIIVVGRTLRFAKRRRDKRERQLFAFHRNNTNEQW